MKCLRTVSRLSLLLIKLGGGPTAATLLDSNIDGRDHPFILGVTTPGLPSLRETLDAAKKQGNTRNLDQVSKDWTIRANMMTFSDAVLERIKNLQNLSEWERQSMKEKWFTDEPNTLSNASARRLADSLFGQKNSVRFFES